MFKAKLIENESYYTLKRKQLLFILLPSIPMGFIVNFYNMPISLTILMLGIYILTLILMKRNSNQLGLLLGNKKIEIDEKQIKIKSKSGIQEKMIDLDSVDKLIIKDNYSMPQEIIKEVSEDISGKQKKNYLVVHANNQKLQFDFEIDSYYMANQLNKIIATWKTSGYNIEILN